MGSLSHAHILQQGRYSGVNLDGLAPEVLLGLYRAMVRLRRCEEALIERYRKAEEMKCPVHFTLGQEAVPAALSLLVQPEDYMFSHHRCHGYYLAKHAPLRAFFAELFGKATGANGGLAGSQEISAPGSNFFSGAILTGASSIAVGAAFAFQHRGTSQIAVAGFGEAATEEGIFWEGITYASVKKLPLVLVCENNLYSMYSAQLARQPGDDISRRVGTFGVKTYTLFGNDAPAAYRALREAVHYSRTGNGPVFLEFYTYRWNAHVGPESDDHINYRTSDEIEFWRTNDPIPLLEEKLTDAGLLTQDAKRDTIAAIDSEIADAFEFAAASPFPVDVDLEALNLSSIHPVAEKLLPVSTHGEFDENQAAARLAPY